MAISAETFFHFTSFENLKKILECKYFQVNYSKEQFSFRGPSVTHYAPMVCFCDIPLTQTQVHIKDYGNFAIGLSKNWGIGHGLNPAFYVNELEIPVTLENLFLCIHSHEIGMGAYEHFFSFMKTYKGPNLKNPKNKVKVFYDEKEWRFVPYVKQFQDKKMKQIYWENDSFLSDIDYIKGHRFFTLDFKLSDIKYIIANTEKNKTKLLTFLKKGEYLEFLQNQSFKILTTDEIYGNF